MTIRVKAGKKTKTVKSIPQLLKKCGWTMVGKTKHSKWRCPCGEHTVIVSGSTSDHRAEQNLLHDAMKCETIKEKVVA